MRSLLLAILLMTLLCKTQAFASDEIPKNDNKKKHSTVYFTKNRVLKIYQIAVKNEVIVSVKNRKGKHIDFFVFDVQGELLQNVRLKRKQQINISSLRKGIYHYRAFCGDEEAASGEFVIR